MVDRHRGLVGRTVLVSVLTLASRLLGFAREVLSAILFGDGSGIFDAFITAWRVPNLLRRLFGEGAISTALVAEMTDAEARSGPEAGRVVFLGTVRRLAFFLMVLSALVVVLVPQLPDLAMFGSDPGPVRELVARLFPFVLLVCLAAAATGALNVRAHYLWPNLAPVLFNVGWIASLCVVGWRFGFAAEAAAPGADGRLAPEEAARQLEMTRWLSWGVLLAGGVQLACLWPSLRRHGLWGPRAWATAKAGAAGARRVLRTSAPLAFGAAVYQINVMVDGFMAEGLLPDGGPTAHYYANRVQQFPLALIAIAAMSSVFPRLKALGASGRQPELRDLHDRTQLAVAFLALPASVGLFVFASPMARLLFRHGAYGDAGVERLAAALAMLALALFPAGAVGLATRAYYALGDFRTPVVVSVAMLALNVAANVAFVVGLDLDVEGLALATAITSWGNLALLLPGLTRRAGPGRGAAAVARRLGAMVALSALAGGAALLAHRAVLGLSESPGRGFLWPALALTAAAVAGIGVYLGLALLFHLPEPRVVLERLRRR